jgi:hypothetical protein
MHKNESCPSWTQTGLRPGNPAWPDPKIGRAVLNMNRKTSLASVPLSRGGCVGLGRYARRCSPCAAAGCGCGAVISAALPVPVAAEELLLLLIEGAVAVLRKFLVPVLFCSDLRSYCCCACFLSLGAHACVQGQCGCRSRGAATWHRM